MLPFLETKRQRPASGYHGLAWRQVLASSSYFVGAFISHLRVGDIKGVAAAVFMLMVAAGALALGVLTHGAGT